MSLDWSDKAAVRRLLLDLRVAVDDADAVVADMLRLPRKRELGPLLHRRNYGHARAAIVSMLAFAMPPESEPDGGAPMH